MKFLKYGSLFCLSFLILIILLVRFTGLIMSVGPFRFDYDEKYNRFLFNERPPVELNGIDGPYIYGDTLYQINHLSELESKRFDIHQPIPIYLNNSSHPEFKIILKPVIPNNKSIYKMPKALIAISDIEGNFNAFSGFLIANGVIDKHYNWIFNDGHIVLNGDFVDRGKHVSQVLWLIYKLEQEAKNAGGKVHFILGNHEIMNIQGNFTYAKNKYKKISTLLPNSKSNKNKYTSIYSKQAVLGKWLRSKPVVVKIGDYIFTHAGLSPQFSIYQLSLSKINSIAHQYLDQDIYNTPIKDNQVNLVCGKQSPFWYRGLVQDYKYYKKIEPKDLDKLLEFYSVKSICIGHTIVDDVSIDYQGKVIRMDVKHGKKKYSSDTQGLLIMNNLTYRINALGETISINN